MLSLLGRNRAVWQCHQCHPPPLACPSSSRPLPFPPRYAAPWRAMPHRVAAASRLTAPRASAPRVASAALGSIARGSAGASSAIVSMGRNNFYSPSGVRLCWGECRLCHLDQVPPSPLVPNKYLRPRTPRLGPFRRVTKEPSPRGATRFIHLSSEASSIHFCLARGWPAFARGLVLVCVCLCMCGRGRSDPQSVT